MQGPSLHIICSQFLLPAAGKYKHSKYSHKSSQLCYTWALLTSPALDQNPSQWSQQGPSAGGQGQGKLHPKLCWCHWPALSLDTVGSRDLCSGVGVVDNHLTRVNFTPVIINGREMRLPSAISASLERLCWLLRFNHPLLYDFFFFF